MRTKRVLCLCLWGCFLLLAPLNKSCAQSVYLGVPTVESLLAESIASSLVQEGLQQVRRDLSNSIGFKGYEKALGKYEKKLRKLEKKHSKLRNKEERTLQRLIDDMASYTRRDAAEGDINRKQEKKQKKVYEYAQKCQMNDRMRVRELVQLRERYYPKIESFIKNY